MDRHHASAAGYKFETDFSERLKEHKLTVLRHKRELERHGISYIGSILLLHPEEWAYDPNRKRGVRSSKTDGFILEYRLSFEHKGQHEFGTTTEKLYWELQKLDVGITPNRFLFVLAGILENEYHAMHFMNIIDQQRNAGHPNYKHVYAVRESELTREWLEERFGATTPRETTLFDAN